MATTDDGGINDEVSLTLAGETVVQSTSYEIRQSVLQQPGEFNIRLGQGTALLDLISAVPANTPFELRINDSLRMVGRTDGYRATAQGGGASELTIFGRDNLAPIHDAHVAQEKSFTDATYSSLVRTVLFEVGLDPSKLVGSGRINRQLQAGVPIKELIPVRTIDQILANVGGKDEAGTTAAQHAVLQSKIGERWYEFVKRHLDRAGLMLWASVDKTGGGYILSAPNANLGPIYRILRRRGQRRNEVNVVHADLLFDTRPRYTYAIIYGRGGGRKKGRAKAKGDATDKEMVDLGFGNPIDIKTGGAGGSGSGIPVRTIDEILANKDKAKSSSSKTATTVPGNSRALVVRDANVQTAAQAAYLASRKLAETRRHGYQLVYTLAGHSTPALGGGRAIWTPDTVVEVQDDEFGVHDVFWIESVEFKRVPQTTTTIRLMRVDDVIFGSAE